MIRKRSGSILIEKKHSGVLSYGERVNTDHSTQLKASAYYKLIMAESTSFVICLYFEI